MRTKHSDTGNHYNDIDGDAQKNKTISSSLASHQGFPNIGACCNVLSNLCSTGLSRLSDYMKEAPFENIPLMSRGRWWVALSLAVQSIMPAEVFFHIFTVQALLPGVADLYKDHGYSNEVAIDISRILVLILAELPNFFGDCTAISPSEEARAILKKFEQEHTSPESFADSRAKKIAYYIASITLLLIAQLGYAALASTDAIAVGRLSSNPATVTALAIYFITFCLVYYNLFLTKKTFTHVEAIINGLDSMVTNFRKNILFAFFNPFEAFKITLDVSARQLSVFLDVSLNNAYRVIVTLYTIYILNDEGTIKFGNSTKYLMILGAISTALATYTQRYLSQLKSVSREEHPFKFYGTQDFLYRFFINKKSVLALSRGMPFATILYYFNAASLPVSIIAGTLLTLTNLYVRYIQMPLKDEEAGLPHYRDENQDTATTKEKKLDAEEISEKRFDELVEKRQTPKVINRINAINVAARIARAIALREFIKTLLTRALPEMFDIHLRSDWIAIDSVWIFVAAAVAENDFYTFTANLTENISTALVKWDIRKSPDSFGFMRGFFTPKGAYPLSALNEAEPLIAHQPQI